MQYENKIKVKNIYKRAEEDHGFSTDSFFTNFLNYFSGRKLFGGYTIVPKACQPSMPSRFRTNDPPICMFNYECTRRNGEVVGACMDGFLFGACCKLPPKSSTNDNGGLSSTEEFYGMHPIDRVPNIPILLNPNGTPLGTSISSSGETTIKTDKPSVTDHLNGGGTTYTKISSSNQGSSPSPDMANNAEKTQLPEQEQADISHLADDFPVLLGQQDIIDNLNLPGLLSYSDSNNNIQSHRDPIDTVNPDQILQIADPVDQLPALFSQGLGKNNHSDPETILLNENGTVLEETYNPDEIFQPFPETPVKITQDIGSTSNTWVKFPDQSASPTIESTPTSSTPKSTLITKMPMVTQMYANVQKSTSNPSSTQLTMTNAFEKVNTIEKKTSTKAVTSSMEIEATTPMNAMKDELVKVPTIIYDMPNKKKDDVLDKEEIAIHHIISILNDTTPNSDASVTLPGPNSSIQGWVSIDETSKPSHHVKVSSASYRPTTPVSSTFPYNYYRPSSHYGPSSTYYNYELVPTETSYSSSQYSTSSPYGSRPSTHSGVSSSSHGTHSSSRPTTNPPAPTVIVLGPLGTEYTTETTQKPATRKPTFKPAQTSKPSSPIKTTPQNTWPILVSTKKPPGVSTTITHNISTVISNVATNNVVSTSYISVNLKDGTSSKPTIDVSTEAIAPSLLSTKGRPTTKRPVIWTTISSWSDKPSFYLKPSTPSYTWSNNNLTPVNNLVFKDTTKNKISTTTPPCEDETAAPDDLINFPPVRNPNLNISVPISQQEKPTIVETFNNTGYPDIELISENDIPTPTFIEDGMLNKVDDFVNKIMESLQGNFQVTT